MKSPRLAALFAFVANAILAASTGCVCWWGVQYLRGVRTAHGSFSLAVPVHVAWVIAAATLAFAGFCARAAFLRAAHGD
jgi:TRAP-type C4-dicarboxylate transport system permease small subunit